MIRLRGALVALLIALAVIAAPVTAGASSMTPAATKSDVSADRMMSWIKTLVSFGIRRPGYPADNRGARWIEGQFRTAGLQHVHLDPVTVNRWVPKTCRLSWWSDATPSKRTTVGCFALPFSNPDATVTAHAVTDDGKGALNGAIGVVTDTFTAIPQSVLAAEALEVVAPQRWVATDQQPIPFGIRNGDLFSDFFTPTSSRGGAAMVGILKDLGTTRYYAPYTGQNVDLPAAWIGEADGEKLTAAMASGPTTATLRVSASREPAKSYNVVGDLPAESDDYVVIGSHHDAPWASAVEDASGISEVLAQAHHWASVPAARRPHRLVFLASAGHMSGAAGSIAFLGRYPKVVKRTVLEVHLEHIARRATVTRSGSLDVTNQPETRWWFTTDRPDLRRLVGDSLRAEHMDRDLILPAVGFFGGDAPLSDAAPFSLAGVPVVSLITTPVYLFDPRDTPRMIDRHALVDVRNAAARMVAGTRALTPPAPN